MQAMGGKMKKIDSGGYAFRDGMALRDYFASKAFDLVFSCLSGERPSCEVEGGERADVVAKWSYQYADAMIKARKGG